MIFSKAAIYLSEHGLMPDFIIRAGIRHLCRQRLEEISAGNAEIAGEIRAQFFESMKLAQIAPLPEMANAQHYEVPEDFFNFALGKHRKYSSCYWPQNVSHLDQAEVVALQETCQHAKLENGQAILELGCGWGSLSLWMAEHYPDSQITSVSNSNSQREYIMAEAARRNLKNLNVMTCDMNHFNIEQTFDRIVSVEMFEHMRNYQLLMQKVASFLKPDGKLFIHIFTHKEYAYLFEVIDDTDWMSKYFFTGGIMPSDDLLLYFNDHLTVEKHWHVSGTHYAKTSEAWLKNMDAHKAEIIPLFKQTYGEDQAIKWWVYWRIFYMACAELWNYKGGNEWIVSHYLFHKTGK